MLPQRRVTSERIYLSMNNSGSQWNNRELVSPSSRFSTRRLTAAAQRRPLTAPDVRLSGATAWAAECSSSSVAMPA